ncbi:MULTISPECIES: Rid family detoxifying hydrolase [Aphanothece]|uniref:Rid family detoxifying hydrolase n=1 Tax=Aphanothece TaxID=1121 RepID=UPI0039848554
MTSSEQRSTPAEHSPVDTAVNTAVNTDAAPAPVGPYNQAVRAGGLLFCSGQIALDPATGAMVGNGDVALETHQVLRNLVAVLAAAGASPAQVVRTTVFLADLGDFATVNAIYADTFDGPVAPARACVEVAALPKGARVEIDCIAVLG